MRIQMEYQWTGGIQKDLDEHLVPRTVIFADEK